MSHCSLGCEKDPRVESSGVAVWAERTPFIPWRVSGGIISLSAHNRLYLYLYLHCIAFVLYCIVFHPMGLVRRNHIMSQIAFSLKGAVWGMMLD